MDFSKLMQEAQKMQSQMKKKQEELESTLFTAESAGGACKVTIKGDYSIQNIVIDKDAIDPSDKEMLEDIVKTAVNLAISKVKDASEKIASDMQNSMRYPGM